MNTLNFETFKADWIWNASADPVNSYVRFVQDFEITDVKNVKLNISADTNYVAYINGVVAGYGQYGDYPFYKVYDEHEIENLLQKGTNRLCILGYYQGVESSNYYRSDAGIIFSVMQENSVIAASGEETFSCPCPSYVSGPVENISPQLSFTFKYNADKDDGWLGKGFAIDKWEKCSIVEKGKALYPRPIKKLVTKERATSRLCAQGLLIREKNDCDIGLVMQSDYLSARRISEISDWKKNEVRLPDATAFCIKKEKAEGKGVYLVFDLGREEAGLINLDIDTAEGTVLEIGYGEHLDDLRVRSYISGRNFACRYVSKGGRQHFTHYFKRAGCRYIQLNISDVRSDIKVYYAGILPVEYPLSYNSIDLKDKLHKKIYEVAIRTLELCMHEHYEDCPWREQALYAMDSRNQALCGYYGFGEYDFPESSLRLLALGLNDDGLLELCAPAKVAITIPSFTFNWIMELYEFWEHSNRIGFVEEMFDTVKKICSSAIDRIKDGILPCYSGKRYWNFYEWAPGLSGEPILRECELEPRIDAPLNMYLIIALDAAAKMANAIGQTKLAGEWSAYAQELRKKTREMFYDNLSGLYLTYKNEEQAWHICELTQALAICSGCTQEKEAENIREKLIIKNNGMVPVTLSYMAFKYDALLMDNKYRKWVFDDIAEIWGEMLFKGATSFWETILGADDFEYAGSLCHGWSAIPVYYYHKFGKSMTED